MEEVFKDIECFEGLYQVSNLGRVKSLNWHTGKEKILKQRKRKDGYLQVDLCKEGKHKTCYVHRLVASAFIPNPFNFNEVNHKNENKANNSVFNLEWCDCKYNNNYGTRNERIGAAMSKPVKCLETGKVYQSTRDAQRETGVAQGNISSCCNGNRKTAGKLHWQFEN